MEGPISADGAFKFIKKDSLYISAYHDQALIPFKILNKKGIINVGGKSQSIYNFAKKNNRYITKIYSKGEFPKKTDMNLEKLKKILNR